MVIVNIWRFRGIVDSRLLGKVAAWGHASLKVGNTYISWWPEEDGRISWWREKAGRFSFWPDGDGGILGNFYKVSPIRNRSFEEDKLDERDDERQTNGRPPDYTVSLTGLDEEAIKNWWQSYGLARDGKVFQGPLPAWQTLSQNCSTIAVKGLLAGGAGKYAGWISPENRLAWTPNDVYRFALDVKKGLDASRNKLQKPPSASKK